MVEGRHGRTFNDEPGREQQGPAILWILLGSLVFLAAMMALHRWTESNDTFLDEQHGRVTEHRDTSFPVGGHPGGGR